MPAALSVDNAVVMASGPSPSNTPRACSSTGRPTAPAQAGKATFPTGSLETVDHHDDAAMELSLPSLESSPGVGMLVKVGSHLRTRPSLPQTRRPETSAVLRASFSSLSETSSSRASADDEAAGSEATTAVGSSAPSPVSRQETGDKAGTAFFHQTFASVADACRGTECGETGAAALSPDLTPHAEALGREEIDREGHPSAGALLLPIPTRRCAFEERDRDTGGSASDSGEFLVRLTHSRRGSEREEAALHPQLAKRVSFGSPLSVEVHQYSYADGCRSSGGSAMSGSSQDSSQSSLSSLSPSPPSSQFLLSLATPDASHSETFRGQHLISSCGLDLYSSSPPCFLPGRGTLDSVRSDSGASSSLHVGGDLSDSESTSGCMTRRHKDLSQSGRCLSAPFRFFVGGAEASDANQKPPLYPPSMCMQSPAEQRVKSPCISRCQHSPEPRSLEDSLMPSASAGSPPSFSRPRIPALFSPLSRPTRCPLSPRSGPQQSSPRKKAAPAAPPCERESPCGAQGPRDGLALSSALPQSKTEMRKPKTSPVEACADARKKKKETRPVTLSPVASVRTRERDKSLPLDAHEGAVERVRASFVSPFRDASCERREKAVESIPQRHDAESSYSASVSSHLASLLTTAPLSPSAPIRAYSAVSSRQQPKEEQEEQATEAVDAISNLAQLTGPSCSLCISDSFASARSPHRPEQAPSFPS
ncbi:conserved hypothetical protein [Neospora caninum Liverpool]|uniref:Uncharacterized protein n=1 Tax=Neospora caninum (strain Liverpool) TaxID=572307 RepID=F0VDF7_NEOCL|nr:conserved hypothetical protein [Neospora caninum Liverpool]CBZ51750.1 conserved hypothetical protein [Neospora caninum Liverpool]CEL65705.1 TPA: hypothetical protein BN1204_015420 [Neospora caninum Liverpool]|eukprot:XP_003881783.1 conserved hypothetical protein [Neospora caninum Liverpool]